MVALLASNWTELEKGPFTPLLHGDPGPTYASDNPDDEELEKLEGMFPPSSPLSSPRMRTSTAFSLSPSSLLSQEESFLEICKVALDELRRVFGNPLLIESHLMIKKSAHM